MNLEREQNLMHYRLVEQIGEGGMGAVWKAMDTSLNREVAIKVLPHAFDGNAERLARFEREARLLASLNHPNVAAIHGIHQVDGVHFLVMELVQGEDLSQRLTRGGLPQEEALRVALEVARGFEAAHEKGVIHRDLKPANVMLTNDGAVKVLDFGLAKAMEAESIPGAAPSMSPTITSLGTVAGMILGTAAYMSPEQAKGQAADRRADIWSFGVVLFEMLTGRRLFEGATISETMAAVLMKEPDWSALPAKTPGGVLRLLQRCLQRDATKRLRDIGDARITLEEELAAPSPADSFTAVAMPQARATARLPWAVAMLALLALAIVAFYPAGTAQDSLGVMRLRLTIPEEKRGNPSPLPMLALSGDGRKLVFVGRDEDNNRLLYVRSVDQPDPVPLLGTMGGAQPIFSPDGQWIAFTQDGKLKKMPVSGGPSMTLCDAPILRGASWGSDGSIILAASRIAGLVRIPDAGGTPEPLTTLQRDPDSALQPSHRWPEILPDGRTVLFTATENDSDYSEARIVALSLDDMQQTTLVEGGTFPRYVPAGFLVFARGDQLFGARFDANRVTLEGPAVPLLEQVHVADFYGSAQLSFSDNGTLAYMESMSAFGIQESTLNWVDRDGNTTPASARKKGFADMALSPDGSRAAVQVVEEDIASIWLLEFERDSMSRLTFSTFDANPLWSPDGEWIVYSSLQQSASRNVYRKRANGTGEPERLTTSPRHQAPSSWSSDGKLIAFTEVEGGSGADIMLLRLTDSPQTEVFLKTPFNEGAPAISPDGRFVAYQSNESGVYEIYALPLGHSGGRTKISTGEAYHPFWSNDGKELLFESADHKLMSVQVPVVDGSLRPGHPREVMDYPDEYDETSLAADDRFLVQITDTDAQASLQEPNLVIGWFETLEATIPRRR